MKKSAFLLANPEYANAPVLELKISCRNLRKMDAFSQSDPCCKYVFVFSKPITIPISCLHTKIHTETITKISLLFSCEY